MEIFHERVKKALKNKKMSVAALARKCNVTYNAAWEWCNDGAPSLERFKQICLILEADPAELLGINPNKSSGGGK